MKAVDNMTSRISREVKQMLSKSYFNVRLQQLFQSLEDAEFIRLTRKFYSTKTSNFENMSEFLTKIKMLDEQITDTEVEITPNKRIIINIMMRLNHERYQNLNQI